MIILTGASASGKSEVGKILSKKYNINKVVTYTTRPMRLNEVDGIDYHFISFTEFERLKDNDFFFETMKYNENYYGTSLQSLNNDVYVILDFNGLRKYLNSNLKFTSFYLACSEEERYRRMIERGDGELLAKERIEVDQKAFNIDNHSLVDYIIDVSNKTIDEIAEEIYLKSHK